jgi:hypothetical protein
MLTVINVHNVSPADVSTVEVFSPGTPTVAVKFGEVTVYIADLAVLDALHEATTRAYELLVETVVAS